LDSVALEAAAPPVADPIYTPAYRPNGHHLQKEAPIRNTVLVRSHWKCNTDLLSCQWADEHLKCEVRQTMPIYKCTIFY